MKEKLMLIDGNSLMNRAFYGLMGPKMLATSDGFYTNAIYGFINILIRFMNEEKPSHLVIAFDMKSPTFRHTQYENYKAHRKGMPGELAMQVPVLKELLDAMNIKRVEIEGYEADDIIGTYAKTAEKEGFDTVIVTGDRDALQLVSGSIKVKLPTTRMGRTEVEIYDHDGVIGKYGIVPEQFIEVKALMGDASDNIPGVPGIGEKTAFELIKKYSSIENIYNNLDILDIKDRVKGLLAENTELANLSRKLATIDVNAPVDIRVCDCDVKEYDLSLLVPMLKKLEFNSLIEKLGINAPAKQETSLAVENKCLKNAGEIQDAIGKIESAGEFAYSLIMLRKDRFDMEPIGISLCWDEDKTVYIDLKSNKGNLETVKKIFANAKIKKYAYDAKLYYRLFDSLEIEPGTVDFDVMIAAYLINPAKENYNIADLSREFIGMSVTDSKELLKYGKEQFKEYDIGEISKIACEQSAVTFKLTRLFKKKLEEDGQEKLYKEVELPLTRVLADMEKAGVLVDKQTLMRISKELETGIESLTTEIIDMAGENFNINSTKQLGVILFEKLGLPVVRKTKTGYSTDAEVLDNLSDKHPIINKILEYRQLVKLKSTYADGMSAVINPQTGRIHSSFNQTVTVTGRISSTEPNLQNIPIKLEMGKKIRKVFVAPEGHCLVDADYSQIELRVLAHISDDKNMIRAFEEGLDIHRITASQVFGMKEEEVTPLMRSRAKAINFGIVYGIGDFSLAKDLKITRKQAREYIDSYLEKYSGVRKYMKETVEQGKEKGYVTTMLGRRRYLAELHSSNFNIRSFGERVAMNTPIQGTAADIIKLAMVKVHKELKDRNLKSRLILQVHDELIVETANDELETVKDILKSCMENAVKLAVSLEVDVHWGQNWYDAK